VVLVGSITLGLVIERFGFTSILAGDAYWATVLVNAVARSFAIAELCRYGLRAYSGIWALVWRVLATLSILLLGQSLVDAWGQPHAVAIYGATLDRNLDLASIIIFAAFFLIQKYYGLALEPLQRLIATGICFICGVDVIGDTIARNLMTGSLFPWFVSGQKALWPALLPQIIRVYDAWSTVHLFAFMVSMGIWCYALRKPLPASSESPVLLPSEVYREMSPAINLRLATFNDRLMELLKP
jgi:hypothetical protein